VRSTGACGFERSDVPSYTRGRMGLQAFRFRVLISQRGAPDRKAEYAYVNDWLRSGNTGGMVEPEMKHEIGEGIVYTHTA
jgi:hypothetical protein